MTVAMWVMFGIGVAVGEVLLMGIILFLHDREDKKK